MTLIISERSFRGGWKMKSNIISLAVTNVIAIGFIIFTIFARFGTHIEVIKRMELLPVSVGYSNSERVVLMEPEDDDDIDRFWVNAKYVYGTDKERELRRMIEDEDTIRLNVFIDPRTDEVLGITKKSTSVLGLIYVNHKLFRYGIPMILGADILIVVLMLLSGRKMTEADKDAGLKKYEYNPSDPKKLRLGEVLHKMRDLRLLYILSSPLWLMMLALALACISTWVSSGMDPASYGEDSSARWIFTGITAGVFLVVFFIYFMINRILKNRDLRPQILQNMRMYLPGTPENIFDDVERDLSKGMPFLKDHNLGISNNFVIGNLELNKLNPVIIPRQEVVEVVCEIFEGRSLTIARNGGVTNARQFYQNFFFRLRNGNYIPVQVNDKFGLWIALAALRKAGYRTVELDRNDIRNALKSRRNRNTYVMEPDRIIVRWDDSTHIIPLLTVNGYQRFEALFYDQENKLSVIVSCTDGSRDSFVIDENTLMLTEGKKLPGSTMSGSGDDVKQKLDVRKDNTDKMTRESFFDLIMNVCDWDKSGDDSKILAPLIDHLSKQSDEYIFAFEDIMSELLYEIDTRKNYEAAEKIYPQSDDTFLYSRCVAIINGKQYYDDVRNGRITDIWKNEFEAILYVAREAWARKYGKSSVDFPHISPLSYETGSNTDGWK